MSLTKRALAEFIGTFCSCSAASAAPCCRQFSGGPALGNIGIGFVGGARLR